MKYFRNEKNEIYAYEDSDLAHDESIKAEIASLEAEKQNPTALPSDEEPKDYDSLIVELSSKVRISDELIPISDADKDDLLKPSDEQLAIQHAKSEHAWVKSELDTVTIELMYHWTGDHRASHTEQVWKDYAIALRDYTSTDDNGNPAIVGESRPSIDDYV